mmetsp:Transcript_9476/g.8480  ORF Transcript_9476/g.8480 Transcript_9476/m.8480 type:complete len:221 (+) Transcript_9476:29-691(+)
MSSNEPLNLPKRRPMVKDRVGCVRSSTYNLPSQDHTYGLKLTQDEETAGQIISSWVTANPSLHKEMGKKIIYSNILALKHGCLNAKSMREYSLAHPNIRMKESVSEVKANVSNTHEGPFGIKTAAQDDTMDNIIQGKYINYANDDADYPDISSIKKKGTMPPPRSTHATEVIANARKESNNNQVKPRFIMKRFQKVKPTMHMHLYKSERDNLTKNPETTE